MLAGACVQFLFHWYISHSSTYHFTFLLTSGHQKFLVTNSVIFHCPLCPPTSMSWYNLTISALNFLSLSMYTFSFFNINPLCSLHFLSLKTFTPAHFISSTALMILSSFALLFLILSRMSISSITIVDTCTTLASNYSFFTSICSSLSLFTPTSQSGLLLRPSVFPILLSVTCFKTKSNLDK